MKGITKKLLAVMLAASMVLQPCISAYAADTGTPVEDAGKTIESNEPAEGQVLTDTGEETEKELVKTDPEEPEITKTDPEGLENTKTDSENPEGSENLKTDPEEPESETEQNAEEAAKTDTESPRIVESGRTVRITENDSSDWEVHGGLVIDEGAVFSGSIKIYSTGRIIVVNGQVGKVCCWDGGLVAVDGENALIRELMIGSEDQDADNVYVNFNSYKSSIENIYVYGNPEKLTINNGNGRAGHIVVYGMPENSKILVNSGAAAENIELKSTPSGLTIDILGTLEELLLTSGDKSYVPNVRKFSSGQVQAPHGYKWVPEEGQNYQILEIVEYKAKIGETEYESLKAAVEAVSAGGSETEIQMIDNEMIDQENDAITVDAGKNIVLDLNGFQVVGTGSDANETALLTNRGTFTVKDSSAGGEGRLMSGAAADWTFDGNGSRTKSIAYTIHNHGILNVESGQIENISSYYPTAAIYNDSSESSVVINIHGGTVKAPDNAVRLFADSEANDNTLQMSGGTLSSRHSIFVQLGKTGTPRARVNVTGGTLSSAGYSAINDESTGGSWSEVRYTLSGGVFAGGIFSYGANLIITGGVYDGDVYLSQPEKTDFEVRGGFFRGDVDNWGSNAVTGFITGGYYKFTGLSWDKVLNPDYMKIENTDQYAADGYTIKVVPKYTARIGETKYETLKAAVEAVPADGTETVITMLADTMINQNQYVSDSSHKPAIQVEEGQKIILDLNGHQVVGFIPDQTTYYFITNEGDLTIKDSSEKGMGRLISGATEDWSFDGNDNQGFDTNWDTIENRGILTVESGWIENVTTRGQVVNNATKASSTSDRIINIKGGTLKSNSDVIYMQAASTTVHNILNMSGGTITAGGAAVDYIVVRRTTGSGALQVDVSGGTLTSAEGTAIKNTSLPNMKEYSKTSFTLRGGYFGGTVECKSANTDITGGEYAGTVTLGGVNGTASISGGFFDESIQAADDLSGFITGGYFKSSESDWDSLVHHDYKLVENTDEHAEEGYVYKVAAKDYVCQIGDVHYETLDEAVAAAEAGNNIYVYKNITSDHTIVVDKPLTISGDHVTLTSTALDAIDVNVESGQVTIRNLNITGKRGIGICNSMEADGLSLTIDSCLIQVSERGITSGGDGIKNYTLTLVGCSINNTQVENIYSDVASDTDTQGISFWNFKGTANINGTVIGGFKYVLNNSAADQGSFNSGAVFNISGGSSLRGWGIINNYASQSTWNLNGVHCVSINKHSGEGNAFGAIVMNKGAVGNTVNLDGCGVDLYVKGDQYQTMILDHENNIFKLKDSGELWADKKELAAIATYKDGGEYSRDNDAFVELDRVTMEGSTRHDLEYYGWLHHMVARNENTGKKYQTLEEAVTAAGEGDTIKVLDAGRYTLPGIPRIMTIEGGVDGVIFEHTSAGSIASVPYGAFFKNVTFDLGNNNYHGFQHNGGITFEGCSFEGKLFTYGNETYKDCTFNTTAEDYNMWVYGGDRTVYQGCTFKNSATGKFLNVYNESGDPHDLTVKDCKFINGSGITNKAAVNVKETCKSIPLKYNVVISGCTTEGSFPEASVADSLVVGEGGIYQVDDRLTGGEKSGITVYLEGEKVYPLMDPVAVIGDVKFETLEEAFAAAEDGDTIMLLKNCAGNGIIVPEGKFADGLTVDFNGFTYTVDGETVGSTGTETNGFQLLKDNTITFTGGTITSEKAKILIQNYSDLTLEGMTLSLNNAGYDSAYTLSNNNGNIVIENSTVNANPAGGFAFDVCRYASYPFVYVTVTGESVIDGNIEVYASNGDAADGFVLMLESGEFTGDIILNETAMNAMDVSPLTTGVIRNREEVVIDSPDGYSWEEYDETYDILRSVHAAKNLTTGKRYSTLSGALDEAESGQTVIPLRDIDNEGFILVMNGVTLDLNGYRITGAKLFYVTGVLKDSGEMKGGFSAQAYHMAGAGAGTWFPIYDAAEELYRLYDLGVTTWDPSSSAKAYAFRFSKTADREEAKTAIAESAYGRVEAVICVRWNDTDGNGYPQPATKYMSFDDSFMDTYCTSEKNLAFTVSFTGLDTKQGPITATPMFIVYEADGSSRGIMFTLPGQTWTIKE